MPNEQLLTNDTLDSLERLAHLPLTEAETTSYLDGLEKILHMFDIMRNIDTSDVDHLSIQAKMSIDSLREDASQVQDNAKTLEAICPSYNPETQRIVVPQVVDN